MSQFLIRELYFILKMRPDEKDWLRFWSYLPAVLDWSKCWFWPAQSCQPNGYGVISWLNHRYRAHRLMAIWLYGDIEGLEIDHVVCNKRACVNPLHLLPTTHYANNMRSNSPAARCARKTQCKNGHPLSGENLYINPANGSRQCRICCKARDATRVWDDRCRESSKRSKAKPVNRERIKRYMKEYGKNYYQKKKEAANALSC